MVTKTDEQELADFEAWFATKFNADRLSEKTSTDGYGDAYALTAWLAYQAGRADLQSQCMRPVIEALETAQNNECGPHRPIGSSDPDSVNYDHDAFMWDYYQRAIDHARRVEEGWDG